MNNKLVCPFCQQELERQYDYNRDTLFHKCNKCWFRGDTILWLALIQAKQDLEIVLKTLKKADEWFGDNQCLDPAKWIRRTVKKIEHKE